MTVLLLASMLTQPRMIPPNERGPSRPIDPCLCAAPPVDDIAPIVFPAPVDGTDWRKVECWLDYAVCIDRVREDYTRETRGLIDCRRLVEIMDYTARASRACEAEYRRCAGEVMR